MSKENAIQEYQLVKSDLVLKLGGLSRSLFKRNEQQQLSKANHWDVRFLMLSKSSLSWSAEKDTKVLNEVDLKEITSVIIVDGRYLEKSFVLKVVTEKKTYLFALDNYQNQASWAAAIAELTGAKIEKAVSF